MTADGRGEGARSAGGDAAVRPHHVLHSQVADRLHGLLHLRHVRRLGRCVDSPCGCSVSGTLVDLVFGTRHSASYRHTLFHQTFWTASHFAEIWTKALSAPHHSIFSVFFSCIFIEFLGCGSVMNRFSVLLFCFCIFIEFLSCYSVITYFSVVFTEVLFFLISFGEFSFLV